MKREAKCHCEQLCVTAVDEPAHVYICHCKECQRRTGSALHYGAFWPRESVECKGVFKTYERGTAAGTKIRFHFCPESGSNVFWESDRRVGYYGIAAGCFADTSFPEPTFSVWEQSIHAWIDAHAIVKRFGGARGVK